MAQIVLNEKYRPKTIDEYIFSNDAAKETVTKWITEQRIPHIFLYGHQGAGKTSLAKMLKNELHVDDSDFLIIDSSSDGRIEVLRDQVSQFMETIPMGENELKIVLLDEIDGMSSTAQKAMRGFLQHPATQYVRFILTCNNPNAVHPAIRSRCQEIQFKSLDKDSMIERFAEILAQENITTDLDNIEAYVDRFYPDFRKLLETVDQYTIDGVLKPINDVDVVEGEEAQLVVLEMFETNKFDNISIRKTLNMLTSDSDWDMMYRFLYDNLHEIGKFTDKDKWSKGIVIIADHLFKHQQVADPEINAAAMFIRLGAV